MKNPFVGYVGAGILGGVVALTIASQAPQRQGALNLESLTVRRLEVFDGLSVHGSGISVYGEASEFMSVAVIRAVDGGGQIMVTTKDSDGAVWLGQDDEGSGAIEVVGAKQGKVSIGTTSKGGYVGVGGLMAGGEKELFASLGVEEYGGRLFLADRRGTAAFSLGIEEYGNRLLRVCDEEGYGSASLTVGDRGASDLTFCDRGRDKMLVLTTDDTGPVQVVSGVSELMEDPSDSSKGER